MKDENKYYIVDYECTNCGTLGRKHLQKDNHIGDYPCAKCGYYNLVERKPK